MTASYVVYIDESGDEGFRFGGGSSEWFVLAAVVTSKALDAETVKVVEATRAQLNKPPGKALHFRDLRHQHRLPLLGDIAAAPLHTVTVFLHKPSLRERAVFQGRHIMYFYATRHLLERVSWLCRDRYRLGHDAGDGSAEIVFSNRSDMAYSRMREYFTRLQERDDVKIDWNVVQPSAIRAFTHAKRRGLQLADAVASSFLYAVEPLMGGYTEDHYARLLKPVVYKRSDKYLGYGLKFLPTDSQANFDADLRLDWVRREFV